jgi:hypothetical protein
MKSYIHRPRTWTILQTFSGTWSLTGVFTCFHDHMSLLQVMTQIAGIRTLSRFPIVVTLNTQKLVSPGSWFTRRFLPVPVDWLLSMRRRVRNLRLRMTNRSLRYVVRGRTRNLRLRMTNRSLWCVVRGRTRNLTLIRRKVGIDRREWKMKSLRRRRRKPL